MFEGLPQLRRQPFHVARKNGHLLRHIQGAFQEERNLRLWRESPLCIVNLILNIINGPEPSRMEYRLFCDRAVLSSGPSAVKLA